MCVCVHLSSEDGMSSVEAASCRQAGTAVAVVADEDRVVLLPQSVQLPGLHLLRGSDLSYVLQATDTHTHTLQTGSHTHTHTHAVRLDMRVCVLLARDI